jgi:hypothetical protein
MTEETAPPAPDDAASKAGRLAGAAVAAVGKSLLRRKSVREALRRARSEAQPDPPAEGEGSKPGLG